MKTTRLIAAIALAFAAMTAAAAKKMEVKVTATSEGGRYGYWVEYEVNGVKCRSDQVSMRMNKSAWARMSPEDRKKTVENVGYYDTRVSQFGVACAREMGTWYDTYVTHYAQGAEILIDRHVKETYPKYFEVFTESTNMVGGLSAYFNEHYAPRVYESEATYGIYGHITDKKLEDMKKEQRLLFSWAEDAYRTLRRAVYIRLGAAVKSTSGDLIEMIVDRCLVPNITPAGTGGMAASIIGTALDYINNIAGIQSRIIKDVVGERATSSAAMKVITHCDAVLAETDEFMSDCLLRVEELKIEIESRYKKLKAEAEARAAAETEAVARQTSEVAASDPVLGPEPVEPTESIVARIRSLEAAIAANPGDDNARKALDDYKTSRSEDVIRRYDEWCKNCEDECASRLARQNALVWPELTDANAKELVDNGGIFLKYTISDEEMASMKADVDKWLLAMKACYRSQMTISKNAVAAVKTLNGELRPILADAKALGVYYVLELTLRSRHDALNFIVPAMDLDAMRKPPENNFFCMPDNFDPDVALSGVRDSLDAFIENRTAYLNGCKAAEEYNRARAVECGESLREYENSVSAVDAFAADLPDYVTEQNVDGAAAVLGDDGHLRVEESSKLGQAFVVEGATGTAATASGYRTGLNTLLDGYTSLSAQMDRCKLQYKAYFSLLSIGRLSDKEFEEYQEKGLFTMLTGLSLASGTERNVRKLKLLRQDFNNRNYAHSKLIEIFADMSNNYDKYCSTDAEATTMYTNLVARAKSWASNRESGSYAACAPGYYETVFSGEPDPYADMVVPLVNEINAARAVAGAIVPGWATYTVKFEANGGIGNEMEPQIFTNGIPQALRAIPWKPPVQGDSFVGWWQWGYGLSYTNCQVITVARDMTLYARWSTEYYGGGSGGGEGGGSGGGGGAGGGGTVDPTDAPVLFAAGKAETPFEGNATYEGWVRNADGTLAGQLTVKAGKPAKPEKGGQSKLTVAYTPFGGKKQTIKLAKDEMPVAGEVATVTLPGIGTVKLTGDAIVGVGVDVQAGKDRIKSKDRGEKAAATAAAASKAGVWTFALNTDAGYAAFSVAVDKKGKGKLSGTLPNGTKVSARAQGVLGDGTLAIPFVFAKKGSLGFVFWVKDDGTVALSDLTGGALGTARPTVVAPSASHRFADGDHLFTAGGVSQKFAVSGDKWNAPKPNKKAEVNPNPTGLKLKFKAKDGSVKGSFTVVDEGGKVKYTVVGAVVGGRLYGTAYSKKAPSLPATAE